VPCGSRPDPFPGADTHASSCASKLGPSKQRRSKPDRVRIRTHEQINYLVDRSMSCLGGTLAGLRARPRFLPSTCFARLASAAADDAEPRDTDHGTQGRQRPESTPRPPRGTFGLRQLRARPRFDPTPAAPPLSTGSVSS
jgi:hypothetical protein